MSDPRNTKNVKIGSAALIIGSVVLLAAVPIVLHAFPNLLGSATGIVTICVLAGLGAGLVIFATLKYPKKPRSRKDT